MPLRSRIMAMVLAGGRGERLMPLTRDRAKPAVPFGGRYRLVDFVLSNLVNSSIPRVKVLTQYKSNSLNEHLSRAWHFNYNLGGFVETVPAQQRLGTFWYRGTADAVYQNISLIFDEEPDHVCVFGGDHIYRMDVAQMLQFHRDAEARVTVAAVPVPLAEATEFGVLDVGPDGKVLGFQEKPENPRPMPGHPELALASMGNYVFDRRALIEILQQNLLDPGVTDFGKHILPRLTQEGVLHAYDFHENVVPGTSERERGYWRDVGSPEAYWQASMDLVEVDPVFNLYNEQWPVRSLYPHLPAAKFVFADRAGERLGIATDSIVAEGCILSGGHIHRTVLHPRVTIHSFSYVEESVLMTGVDVGRRAMVRRAIVDKGVRIPPGFRIGYDAEEDRRRFTVTDSGLVVVPKGAIIEP
ncbi:MAG: glucose-1-phosphate adenylyltransferase [Gemmatimonadota bacterium]